MSAVALGQAVKVWARIAVLGMAAGAGCSAPAPAQEAPLAVERTIPMPEVKGRIDHFAYDLTRGRLFVAALGNGTVEALDVAAGRSAGRIQGLQEPQGLAYLPARDELAVATGGDGVVRFYRAADLAPAGEVVVGGDADNLRVQAATGLLVVGSDTLVVVDPGTRRIVASVRLPAHAEGFQLDGARAYVNLPDAGRIGVVDLAAAALVGTWPNGGRRFNYPLALDRKIGEVAIAYRLPARVVTFDPARGVQRQALETCADSDDLFYDAGRSRLYVTCGSGHVDVFERRGAELQRLARVATAPGARTSLFVPELDRLFVAAPARGGRPAAILVLRPR
jgi:hypothetical protein